MSSDKYEQYGIYWYRGSGSQSYLLSKNEIDEKVLIIKQYTLNHGHSWAICSREKLKEIVKKNRGIYEIITDKRRKLYFDIDSEISVLEDVKKIIKQLIPDGELYISGYNSEDKYSYHIIVNNYYLDNVDKCLGVKNFCKENQQYGFDWKVYTKNRAMKCVNQSKPKKPVQEIIHNENIEGHFITCYFPENCKDAYEIFKNYEEFSDYESFSVDYEPKIMINDIKQERKILPIKEKLDKETDLIYLISPEHDHKISYIVALYLNKIGSTYEDFIKWRSRKGVSDEIKEKWKEHWKKIEKIPKDKNNINISHIIKILEREYPNIRREYYERIFFDYGTIEPDQDIETQYGTKDMYSEKLVDYVILPMGSNKTGSLIDYINYHTVNNLKTFKNNKNFKSVIFLNCRRSLAHNLKQRIGDDFTLYNDKYSLRNFMNEEEIKQYKKESEIKKIAIPRIKKLITTPNSLHYSNNNKYDLLVIDEVESFHTSWLSTETHKDKYAKNWETFKNIIKNAKKIIILDALYSFNTIKLFERFNIKREQINIIGSSYKYPGFELIMHDKIRFLEVLTNKLKQNKKCYVFWPYKTENKNHYNQNQLLKFLEKSTDRNLKALLYNSDTLVNENIKESLKNINKHWSEIDLIIVNQCITVGVNYDIEDVFDSVFLADASFVTARDITQTARRIRRLKSNEIHYTCLGSNIRDRIIPNDVVPREYLEDILIETKCKSIKTTKWLLDRANIHLQTKIYKRDKDFKKIFKEVINDDTYNWDSIPDIQDDDVYERLITAGASCTEDILRLTKYKFRKLLLIKNEILLKEAWQYRKSLVNYFNINKNNINKNNCDGISLLISFISKDILKVEDEYLDKSNKEIILNNFSFKDLDKKHKSDSKIICDCINLIINMNYYTYNKKKKQYEITEDGLYFKNIIKKIEDERQSTLEYFIEENEEF